MRKAGLLLKLIPLIWLAACQMAGRDAGVYGGMLVLEGKHVFNAGETLPGMLAVLGGQVEIGKESQVAGPVYLIGGDLTIDGEVTGDVSAIGGDLFVGPGARIGGDLRSGSVTLDLSPQAQVNGQVMVGASSGLELDDLFPERSLRDELLRIIPTALLLAVFAYLGVSLVPRPLERVMRATIDHPIVSAAMGLLVGIVAPIFLIVMAYTLILIPVTVIGIVLGILVVGFGQIALGIWTGRLLEQRTNWMLRPPVLAFLGTFAFRLILGLLALIPFAGSFLELLAAIVVLGAVTLTRFGLREFVPEYAQADAG